MGIKYVVKGLMVAGAIVGATALGTIYNAEVKQGVEKVSSFVGYEVSLQDNLELKSTPQVEENIPKSVPSHIDEERIRKIFREEVGRLPEKQESSRKSFMQSAYQSVCSPHTSTLAQEVYEVFDRHLDSSGSFAYNVLEKNGNQLSVEKLKDLEGKLHGYLAQKMPAEEFAEHSYTRAQEGLGLFSQDALRELTKNSMGKLEDTQYGPIMKSKSLDFWVKQMNENFEVKIQ
jgi:hypothetical protein